MTVFVLHMLAFILIGLQLKVIHQRLDGAGILAVPTFNKAGKNGAVYLIDKTDGSIRRTFNYSGPIFAQPVFANNELLIAGPDLQAYTP